MGWRISTRFQVLALRASDCNLNLQDHKLFPKHCPVLLLSIEPGITSEHCLLYKTVTTNRQTIYICVCVYTHIHIYMCVCMCNVLLSVLEASNIILFMISVAILV